MVNSSHEGWVFYKITIAKAAWRGQKRRWRELMSGKVTDLKGEVEVRAKACPLLLQILFVRLQAALETR